MKEQQLIQYAIDEVRRSPSALRASAFVFDVLISAAREKLDAPRPQRLHEFRLVHQLRPNEGLTAEGDLLLLLEHGPRTASQQAVLNCFFAVGLIERLQRRSAETRRSFVIDVVAQIDHLLANTGYSPYPFLAPVAPAELGTVIWDRVVQSLVDDVNHSGGEASVAALIRVEVLRYLPEEVRRAYIRRLHSDCFEAVAALRYTALLAALEEAPPEGPRPFALLEPSSTPQALPPAPEPKALSSGETRLLPPAAAPAATVCGEPASGPAGLLVRALGLLSGVLLLRDLGALLLRLVGLRRHTTLQLEVGQLVVEKRMTLLGGVIRNSRRAYRRPHVHLIEGGVPHHQLYLLLGLSVVTLLAALVLPLVISEDAHPWRYSSLAVCGAVLAGIASDLTRFLASYLRRGHCTLTVGVGSSDVYRLSGVPETAVARFAQVARLLRDRRPDPGAAPPTGGSVPPPSGQAPPTADLTE